MSPIAKAIAGAVAAIIVAALAKYNVVLTPDVNSAIVTLLNAVFAGAIGFLTVYVAPKNK